MLFNTLLKRGLHPQRNPLCDAKSCQCWKWEKKYLNNETREYIVILSKSLFFLQTFWTIWNKYLSLLH